MNKNQEQMRSTEFLRSSIGHFYHGIASEPNYTVSRAKIPTWRLKEQKQKLSCVRKQAQSGVRTQAGFGLSRYRACHIASWPSYRLAPTTQLGYPNWMPDRAIFAAALAAVAVIVDTRLNHIKTQF